MSKARQPFSWYGGKVSKRKFVIPKLPQTGRYVEPFGGSGVILLNKKSVEGIEVFNDLNENVMTFFRVLRNSPEKLMQKLQMTPYHEGVYKEAYEVLQSDSVDDLEQAWAFYTRIMSTYNSTIDSGFSYATKEVRRDRPQTVSRFYGKVNGLLEIADRLQRVQFMSRDALEVIDRFDKGDDTVFYLDPPYPHETRNSDAYEHEMTREQHKEMIEIIRDVDGYVCLSSYRNDLYDSYLSDWQMSEGKERTLGASNSHRKVNECLYMNYDPNSTDIEFQEIR